MHACVAASYDHVHDAPELPTRLLAPSQVYNYMRPDAGAVKDAAVEPDPQRHLSTSSPTPTLAPTLSLTLALALALGLALPLAPTPTPTPTPNPNPNPNPLTPTLNPY